MPSVEGRTIRFSSVAAALSYLRKHVDVAVALPTYLPAGISLAAKATLYSETREGVRRGQLELTIGPHRPLFVQFGLSELDGCDPEGSVVAEVGGQAALLRESPNWAELIWPATHDRPAGVYGLSGSIPRAEMMRMAETMPASTG